jgi:hypothetical protein
MPDIVEDFRPPTPSPKEVFRTCPDSSNVARVQ